MEKLPERWLRGPVDGVPPLLQPAAHALLQATDEIKTLLHDFPGDLLWSRPAGLASPGFHLLHIAGVLNRMGTYAQGAALSEEQLAYLKEESHPQLLTSQQLIREVEEAVQKFIAQLKATDESTLAEARTVGRKRLPSTVISLLFHAAEHTVRHTGQLLVTVKVLKGEANK